MKDLFFFDSMLTPKIITFIYWLSLLAVLVSGLGAMFSRGGFLMGVGVIVAGAVIARIYCELLIVIFKIHENLKSIAEKE